MIYIIYIYMYIYIYTHCRVFFRTYHIHAGGRWPIISSSPILLAVFPLVSLVCARDWMHTASERLDAFSTSLEVGQLVDG